MMINNYILFGSGGHFLSCVEVINSNKYSKILGYVSPKKNNNINYRYLGDEKNFKKPSSKNLFGLIAFGGLNFLKKRQILFKNMSKKINFKKIIASTAYVSKSAQISKGSILMHNTFVNSNVQIDENCLINTGSIIEHEVKIGNGSVISPGCIINGNVSIGKNCFIGSGTIIFENINIENNSIVGSGLTIRKNIKKSSNIISSKQID